MIIIENESEGKYLLIELNDKNIQSRDIKYYVNQRILSFKIPVKSL